MPLTGTGQAAVLRLLADDLTGALDTAARFVPVAGTIPTIWSAGAIPPGTIAMDSGTREWPAPLAATRVASLVPALLGADIAFKKVDSLLRGAAVAELAACLPHFDHCVFAPAFPFQGRITRDGRQWAREGAGWRPVGSDADAWPVRMLDAATDADLNRIVAAGRRLAGRVLWCGSAGLAGALAGCASAPAPRLIGPVLALIGSDHPVSRRQIAAARAVPNLTPRTVSIPPDTPRDRAAHMIKAAFATILRHASRPGVLFVSGGETLLGVCVTLGADRLDVDGEIEPGVPTAILRGGVWDGQRIVAKSGAFGDDSFLVRLALAAPCIAGQDG
jgi:uncharacterized protein YgbK (DUF1537 family)